MWDPISSGVGAEGEDAGTEGDLGGSHVLFMLSVVFSFVFIDSKFYVIIFSCARVPF